MKRILGGMIAAVLLIHAPGCRDHNADLGGDGPQLSGPTLFVPMGILRYPQGIAVDATGDIWVSDTNGDRITRFSSAGSQRLSQGGVSLPTFMGFDRSTNDVLVVSQNTIQRINPRNESVTTIAAIGGSVDASATFNVRTGEVGLQSFSVRQLGDIDGTTSGDIYVSAVTTDAENYLLRVRSGQVTAVAFSDIPGAESPTGATKFLSADAFGSILTAFLFPGEQLGGITRPYVVFPGNLSASRTLASAPVSDGARGSGMDRQGNLYIADSRNRQLIIISTTPERLLQVLDIPNVSELVEAAPWDVAVGADGSVYVALVDLFDSARQRGAVIKYTRSGY